MPNAAMARLKARFARIAALGEAAGMLHWDAATMMPSGGGAARGEQLAALAGLSHELLTAPVVEEDLEIALAEGAAHRLIAELAERAVFDGATEVIRLDGLRVEYADGFGLMPDTVHYSSDGLLRLGRAFAGELSK